MKKKRSLSLFILLFLTSNSFTQDITSLIDDIFSEKPPEIDIFYSNPKIKLLNETITEYPKKNQAIFYYYCARYYHRFNKNNNYINYLKEMKNGKLLSLQAYVDNLEKTRHYYKKAQSIIKDEIEKNPTIDTRSWYAEIIANYALLENVKQMFELGLKVQPFCEKILKDDPNNITAKKILASKKVYAPRLYGGNAKKGQEMFEEIINCGQPLTKEEKILCYSNLAYAYALQNKKKNAELWIQKSAEIYPNYPFLEIIRNWKN